MAKDEARCENRDTDLLAHAPWIERNAVLGGPPSSLASPLNRFVSCRCGDWGDDCRIVSMCENQ